MSQPTRNERRFHLCCTAVVMVALLWSGWSPYDRGTWWMEVAPVLIALPVLLASYRRFPLTDLLYLLICIHALVLILGGAYTYARVPLGFWIQDAFELSRNPYDKIGHFMQGLVPALVGWELLYRHRQIATKAMLSFLCVCIALEISAGYELIEWAAALALGQGAEEFLGTQGDPWDTQSDMFMALIGSLTGLILLRRPLERQIRQRLPRETLNSLDHQFGACNPGIPGARNEVCHSK